MAWGNAGGGKERTRRGGTAGSRGWSGGGTKGGEGESSAEDVRRGGPATRASRYGIAAAATAKRSARLNVGNWPPCLCALNEQRYIFSRRAGICQAPSREEPA